MDSVMQARSAERTAFRQLNKANQSSMHNFTHDRLSLQGSEAKTGAGRLWDAHVLSKAPSQVAVKKSFGLNTAKRATARNSKNENLTHSRSKDSLATKVALLKGTDGANKRNYGGLSSKNHRRNGHTLYSNNMVSARSSKSPRFITESDGRCSYR